MSDKDNKSEKAKLCPTCGNPAIKKSLPFCSKRCADIDLGRWFEGAYAIPAFDSSDDSIIETEMRTSGNLRLDDPNDDLG